MDILAAGLDEAPLTPGLHGRGSTVELGQAIAAQVEQGERRERGVRAS